jgi:CubicO group peptidase (beta-lactamase class C family)
MKKTIYLVLLLSSYLPVLSQQQALSSIIKDNNVSGIQLVYTKDNTEQVYNAGVIRNGSTTAISSETIFHAASLSKSVFAYIFFRLYDRGLISLDTPLLPYIGQYAKFNDPRIALITARMVLRHTTGLPNWGDDNGYRMVFTPDSCFSYSGEGYAFLQKVVEKITGKSLNELAMKEVFIPLKMENSSFVWDRRFTSRVGFDPDSLKDRRYINTEANAAYSLLTTAHDYTLFLQALLSGKGLQPATAKMIVEKATAARYNMTKNSADPHIGWGLGVGLQDNEKGHAIWHWGDGYGGDYKCFYMAFPETKESLVFFTHSEKGLDITPKVVDLFLGKQTTWAINWLGYGYANPPAMALLKKQLTEQRFASAIAVATQDKQNDAQFWLSENDLNGYGYELLGQRKIKEAVEIFKLNVSLFPQSPNAYDSLGEAYEADGNKELAVKNYQHVLALRPESTNAVKHLKQLGGTN